MDNRSRIVYVIHFCSNLLVTHWLFCRTHFHSVMDEAKRVKLNPVESPYPFVDYDSWMYPSSSPLDIEFVEPSSTGSLSSGIRPATLWFQASQNSSPECVSAQQSVVHHMVVLDPVEPPTSRSSIYVSDSQLKGYQAFLSSIPPHVSHPYFDSELYRDAQVIDVICSGVCRNPHQYSEVFGLSSLIPSSTPSSALSTSLVVASTDAANQVYPSLGAWERVNRVQLLEAILTGFHQLADGGDMVVPLRGGIVASVWLGGIIFRMSQLFFKITILRSALSPVWDDKFYLVGIGKKKSKSVKRVITLIKRLVDCYAGKEHIGYTVPPACFTDPTFVAWLRSINAQLIGTRLGASSSVPSLEWCASKLRIKKFLWPNQNWKIGIYFGTFNPVHVNHISLANWAHDHCGVDKVILVPNEQQPHEGLAVKENVLPLTDRIAMLELATQEYSDWLLVKAPTGKTHRWESKGTMAKEFAEQITCDSQFVGNAVLLLGGDSWEKARTSCRDKTTRHFIGIAKLNIDVLVFARGGSAPSDSSEYEAVPKPIRDRVAFVADYADPVSGLSSSVVREQIASERVTGLNPLVEAYIRAHSLYTE